jgi:extradiol dioxygenase family protein
MSTRLTAFHVAVQVRDIAEARHFYGQVLDCMEGRSDTSMTSSRRSK